MTTLIRTKLELRLGLSDMDPAPVFTQGGFTITVTRPEISANPEPMLFEVTGFPDVAALGLTQPANAGGYEVRYHRLVYQWDFGPLEAGSFDAPSNILPEHNEKRYAYGPRIFHVFETPGLKPVTLRVFDMSGATLVTLEGAVRVYDADTVFAGTKTIYADPSGLFPDKPAGCVEVSSYDAAATLLRDGGFPRRILLAGGQNYTVSERVIFDTSPNFFLQTRNRASAGRAVLDEIPESHGGFAEEKLFLVDGVEMSGTWTNVDHTGQAKTGCRMNASGFNLLMNSQLSGVNSFTGTALAERPIKCLFWDVDATEWRGVGALLSGYGPGSFVGGRGLRLAQRADALQFTNFTPGTVPDDEQWGIRHWGAGQNIYYESVDFFVQTGNYNADRPNGQPSFRLSHIDEASYININRSTFESSLSFAVSVDQARNLPYQAVCCNIILDMVAVLGCAQAGGVNPNHAGTTVRNCYIPYPDVKSLSTKGYAGCIDFQGDTANPAPNIANAPMEYYGNTYTSEITTANHTKWNNNTSTSTGVMTNFELTRLEQGRTTLEENNLFHHPNLARGDAEDQGPVANVSPSRVLNPRYPGILWEQRSFSGDTIVTRTPISDPSFASAPFPLLEPASGSVAYQSATSGLIAPHNLLGQMRGASPNRGAI